MIMLVWDFILKKGDIYRIPFLAFAEGFSLFAIFGTFLFVTQV